MLAGVDRGAELIDLFRRIGRDFMIVAERSAAEEPDRQSLELVPVLLGEVLRLGQPFAHVDRAAENYGGRFDVPHRRVEVAKLGRDAERLDLHGDGLADLVGATVLAGSGNQHFHRVPPSAILPWSQHSAPLILPRPGRGRRRPPRPALRHWELVHRFRPRERRWVSFSIWRLRVLNSGLSGSKAMTSSSSLRNLALELVAATE